MSTGTGVNVSKANAYSLLGKPTGANVSKVNAYVALTRPAGLNVSKTVAYVLLAVVNTNPPVWPAVSLATGIVGLSYVQNWDLSTAASPVTYSIASGSLPPGLSLSSAGTAGSLTGTPTTAGTYTFSIQASNAYGSATQSFTVDVVIPASASSGNYGWIG